MSTLIIIFATIIFILWLIVPEDEIRKPVLKNDLEDHGKKTVKDEESKGERSLTEHIKHVVDTHPNSTNKLSREEIDRLRNLSLKSKRGRK